MQEREKIILEKLAALMEGVPYRTANLANASALLWQELPDLNWAGFYERMGDKLVLGPFQGKPACIVIPVGQGVCGTAAAKRETQRVEDVHLFPGHIACDSASRSEIVAPLYCGGDLWGVLDLDSPLPGRFTPEDQRLLERAAALLGDMLEKTR